jgi:hypothetical protein
LPADNWAILELPMPPVAVKNLCPTATDMAIAMALKQALKSAISLMAQTARPTIVLLVLFAIKIFRP